MSPLLLVIIVILLSLIIFYFVVEYIGWTTFTMKNNENFMLSTDYDNTILPKVLFKNCMLTITSSTNAVKTADVSSALNRMTNAFTTSDVNNYIFKLADPGLNVYSFTIPGFNDKGAVPSVWENSKLVLNGRYKISV